MFSRQLHQRNGLSPEGGPPCSTRLRTASHFQRAERDLIAGSTRRRVLGSTTKPAKSFAPPLLDTRKPVSHPVEPVATVHKLTGPWSFCKLFPRIQHRAAGSE